MRPMPLLWCALFISATGCTFEWRDDPDDPADPPDPGGGASCLPTADSARLEEAPECAAVVRQSSFCVGLTESSIVLIGLDDGTRCSRDLRGSIGAHSEVTSLAWMGDELFACSQGAGLLRISMDDGSITPAGVACDAVT